jgi:rSAM/selenodomain-associated transferase 2
LDQADPPDRNPRKNVVGYRVFVPAGVRRTLEPRMVSVIVPVYRERRRLPACLDRLLPQAGNVGAEVLVVDGGSDDGTADVARRYPGVRLLVAPRGRGSQMNAGARVARGSLLWFLAADTLPPHEALAALDRADRRGEPAAGGFRQRFDVERPLLRGVSALHNLRAALTGVCYGDQAPFVRRELFLRIGGFREDMDLEDVEFGSRLRRRTRPRLLDFRVTTSARRFEREGAWRTTAEGARILLHWAVLRRAPRSSIFFEPTR